MSEGKEKFRSAAWFGRTDKDGFIHRSWMRNQGFPDDVFDGRPVIGICNTWSELTPCNAHLRALAERVKRGVWEAGGFPLEFPVMSTGETNMRPTAMLFRNLVSMDVEESIRANPIDGVVLMCGCDKTTPSLIMGAASCDVPAIVVSGGPMLNGKFRGKDIGSGTSVWKFSEDVKAGKMTLEEFSEAESCMSRSAGHCMTMGTASTMGSMAESLGLALPYNSTIPAVDSRRSVLAHLAGRRIVEMVREDLRISKILTPAAFENAIRINGAIGGSTNAVIHLARLRRPRRSTPDPGGLGPAGPGCADAGRSHALGALPHGGLLLCRRPSSGGPRHGRTRICCRRTPSPSMARRFGKTARTRPTGIRR
jgi:L-arabonate dehydrase